jgi:CheY-like chemotaxis protein
LRVLLVDDDPLNARLVRAMLGQAKDAAFELERADRLALGLEMARATRFDVVLLDLLLPDSFGVDTVAKFAKAVPGVPIIALTGVEDTNLVRDVLNQGARDFLMKGKLQSESLVRAVRYAAEAPAGSTATSPLPPDAFRSMFEQAEDAMLVATADAVVVYANAAASALLGAPVFRLVGEPLPLDKGSLGSEHHAEIRRPDGTRAHVETRACATTWDGRAAHLIALRQNGGRGATPKPAQRKKAKPTGE